MINKLKSIKKDVDLPALPDRPRGEDRNKISIFSLALLRLKVSEQIEKVACGIAGLRTSHIPSWANEVLHIHDATICGNEGFGDECTDDTVAGDHLKCNGLRVTSLLSETEVETMRKLAGLHC